MDNFSKYLLKFIFILVVINKVLIIIMDKIKKIIGMEVKKN